MSEARGLTTTCPARIESERLDIRPWTPADAPDLLRAHVESGEHLAATAAAAAGDLTLEAMTARVAKQLAAAERGERVPYAVRHRASGVLVAGAGLIARYGPGGLEIGYWVHRAWTRRGVATEIAGALTRVAFEVLGVPFMEIRCAKSNLGSAGVPRKLGYRLDATLPRRVYFPSGEVDDALVFSLHAEDYEASAAKAMSVSAYDDHDARVL